MWLSHPPIFGLIGTVPPFPPRVINSIRGADPYTATPDFAGATNPYIAKPASAVHTCRIRNTLQGSINGYASI